MSQDRVLEEPLPVLHKPCPQGPEQRFWGGARPGGRRLEDRGGAYHEDGLVPQVGLLHGALGQRGHCAPPRQQGQQRRGAGGGLELRQRLAPGPAVELGREQQPRHRGLHVLLRVLVGVEGLPQLRGHVLCGARRVTVGQGPGMRREAGTGTGGWGTWEEARRAGVQFSSPEEGAPGGGAQASRGQELGGHSASGGGGSVGAGPWPAKGLVGRWVVLGGPQRTITVNMA